MTMTATTTRPSRPPFSISTTWQGAGATEVAVGSHRRGELPSNELSSIVPRLIQDPMLFVAARAGDVLIIDVMLVHRAGRNDIETDRRAVLVECKAADARDLGNNGWGLKELPLGRGGEPFRSNRSATPRPEAPSPIESPPP